MCMSCGCSRPSYEAAEFEHGPHHDHGHDRGHAHAPIRDTLPGVRVEFELERRLLERNERAAARVRGWLWTRDIVALNLLSSPGSGKTTLVERTIRELSRECPITVIEGDQATELDAERVRAAGARAIQINTGAGCHLDAAMIERALLELHPDAGSLVLIENVGNLVCPALFDLGESAKVVLLSVTEGEDKPLKYPHAFRAADLLLVNKIDLLPHARFDVARCLAWARKVNPRLEAAEVSAEVEDGLAGWFRWLRRRRAASLEGVPSFK